MTYVPAKLPAEIITELDTLVKKGVHENRSQAIRDILKKGLGLKREGKINATGSNTPK